jgi:hypothetical protein
MSLDVFVMPIWRFKAGLFETAVEQMFRDSSGKTEVRIVTPEGVVARKHRWNTLRSFRARWRTRRLIKEAERQLGMRLTWMDDGPIVCSQQASWGFEGLRVYAKWLDFRDEFPSFESPPDRNFYEHPVYKLKTGDRELTFGHLVRHCCYNGYLVPCEFEQVLYLEPHQVYHWTFHNSFGSTVAISRELRQLEAFIRSRETGEKPVPDEAWNYIQAGFDSLNLLAQKSLEHKLPIIFYG